MAAQGREKQMVSSLTDALNQLVTEARKKAPSVKLVCQCVGLTDKTHPLHPSTPPPSITAALCTPTLDNPRIPSRFWSILPLASACNTNFGTLTARNTVRVLIGVLTSEEKKSRHFVLCIAINHISLSSCTASPAAHLTVSVPGQRPCGPWSVAVWPSCDRDVLSCCVQIFLGRCVVLKKKKKEEFLAIWANVTYRLQVCVCPRVDAVQQRVFAALQRVCCSFHLLLPRE